MNSARKFISWQPVLTDHQAFTYEELALRSGVPVVANVMTMEDATRQAEGWTDTQVSSVERRLIPKRRALLYCYRQMRSQRNDVHVFGSAFQSPLMMACLLLAIALRIEFYLISEPYSPIAQGYFSDGARLAGRFKSLARPFIYKCYVFVLRRKLSGIFAISNLAISQFRAAGMAPDKLFPFGYFVPGETVPAVLPSAPSGAVLRLVFVASLISRKGLDILIAAVRSAQQKGHAISLDVFGPGDPAAFSFDDQQIRSRGRIPFGKAQETVAAYDVFVLPSRYDGWGVVVNEAICAGVPVITSDQVGASVLISKFGCGAVFPSCDAEALANLLSAIACNPARLQAMRHAAMVAGAHIQPAVAAAYLLDVVRAPVAGRASVPSPWYP